jgi:hypothetical protein
MPEKTHWPFGSEESGDARGIERSAEREAEREQARLQDEAARRARTRHDRLIVGGRAHARKRGLS